MENASKALLIAGAILIVIVLISIGMLIVNSTNDVTEQAQTTATAQSMQTFNSQFTQYEGTQKGSTIKNLYQSVKAVNAANEGGGHHVDWTCSIEMKDIKNSHKYTVELVYGDEETENAGYVTEIIVEDASESSGG